jgi:TRAP-type uncharacterized transport system substrate-binding protein
MPKKMPQFLPKRLQSSGLPLRELAITAGPFLLIATLLLVLAYQWLQPTPPRQVVMATGGPQGAYHEFGKRYAEQLKRHGITVTLRQTQGAAENLALIRQPDSGVDIVLAQGGGEPDTPRTGSDDEHDAGLVSLGSVFYEPLWLFYREDAAQRLAKAPELTRLSQLVGGTLNIGAPGSGVPPLMERLIAANDIAANAIGLQRLPTTPAVVDLLEGRLDALALASAPEALMVQMLLKTPGIRLMDFAQSEAYARRFPFMSPVVLPRGVVDLAADRPAGDVRLVAPTATLVARDTLHPALIQLFVQAAQQVHGGAGWFQHKGDFPNAANTERPVAPEAQRYYRSGPPLLQRYLPFWLANLADRMWLAMLGIIAVLIPLARVLPPLYEFRIRRRVFRWYAQLRAVEDARGKRPAADLLADLADIEQRVDGVSVPLSYADELYSLRSHIDLVRQRVQGVAAAG